MNVNGSELNTNANSSSFEEDSETFDSYFSDSDSLIDEPSDDSQTNSNSWANLWKKASAKGTQNNSAGNFIDTQCVNKESVITLMPYETTDENVLFTVKVQNANGKFTRGSCMTKDELKQTIAADKASDTSDFIMSIYTTPKKEKDYLSGFGGKPTRKLFFRLPSNGIYVTIGSIKRILNQPHKVWYALLLFGGKRRRLGNINGYFGASMNHGQVPGFLVYKLFTKDEIKQRVVVQDTNDDYLTHFSQFNELVPLDDISNFKQKLFNELIPTFGVDSQITDIAFANGRLYVASFDGKIRMYNMTMKLLGGWIVGSGLTRIQVQNAGVSTQVQNARVFALVNESISVLDTSANMQFALDNSTSEKFSQVQLTQDVLYALTKDSKKCFTYERGANWNNMRVFTNVEMFTAIGNYMVTYGSHTLECYLYNGTDFTKTWVRRIMPLNRYGQFNHIDAIYANSKMVYMAGMGKLMTFDIATGDVVDEDIISLPRVNVLRVSGDYVITSEGNDFAIYNTKSKAILHRETIENDDQQLSAQFPSIPFFPVQMDNGVTNVYYANNSDIHNIELQ